MTTNEPDIELVSPETEDLIRQLVVFTDNDPFCLSNGISAYELVSAIIVLTVESSFPGRDRQPYAGAISIISKATEIEPDSNAWIPTLYDVVGSMPEEDDSYND